MIISTKHKDTSPQQALGTKRVKPLTARLPSAGSTTNRHHQDVLED
jgi:hypothetical protein